MERGNLRVLMQPAELVIIAGAGVSTLLTANPLHILKDLFVSFGGIIKGSRFKRDYYLATLKMMYDLFNKARKEGPVSIEADIEQPQSSAIFSRNKMFTSDHHAVAFVCDTMRMTITGGVEAFDVDQMMELDMEVHHHSIAKPVMALSTVADALPGLGIVAAVLGVVITMGALGGPPEEIGHKVAAALVGTFLGILLCYGVVGPISTNMSQTTDEEKAYYHVLRVLMLAFMKGTAPVLAVEMGRRATPGHVRPSFQELEALCRNESGGAAAAGAS